MKDLFQKQKPEKYGIPTSAIHSFLDEIENSKVNMHGFLMLSHGRCIAEGYWKPFHKDSQHRMYSVSKSVTSLAIGLLEEEGKIKLTDPICKYFEDKLGDCVHPWILETTIQDMLCMTSAHELTTFKRYDGDDWVESFFRMAPTHKPGTIFSYDTSASHVLAALVERLAGMGLMEYLRIKFFDEIGVSKEAKFLKDPMGVSQGGSGMMCTLRDMASIAQLCLMNGEYDGKALLPKAYLKKATSFQVPTTQQGLLDEQFGYGYQMWINRHGGFTFYGMGGQFAICFPEHQFILATMSDTMGNPSGLKDIYDAFYDNVYIHLTNLDPTNSHASDQESKELEDRLQQLELKAVIGALDSSLCKKYNQVRFQMEHNEMNLQWISLEFQETRGRLVYGMKDKTYQIDFGLGEIMEHKFPGTEYRTISSAAWMREDLLFLRSYVIDESMGHLDISVKFKGDTLTIGFKRTEENFLKEYNGMVTGYIIN